jgi:pimeloyl-ACP methyl ester carboxylesterase
VSDVTSRDGATIAFERSGAGPTVVFVGGALTTAAAMSPLAARLSTRCDVLVYDRRGRGSSGDTEPYAVEREVEDLAAVLEVAGGRASVYGHSSGAVLALEAASRGLPIDRLALYEPPFVVDDSRPPLPPDYVARLIDLVAGDRRGDAIEYFMTTGAAAPADTVASMRSAPFWPAMEAMAHTLAYDGTVMGDTMSGRPLQGERWASVTMPTLVMDGGASPDWARNSARGLAAVLPDARYRTLEGQTHGVTDEAMAPVLEEFFG